MDVLDFANQATDDGIYIRIGDRAIKLPLLIDESGIPVRVEPTGESTSVGFADSQAVSAAVVFILGTAVKALLPPALRATLEQQAEAVHAATATRVANT